MTTSWSGERRSFPTSVRRAILERDRYRCVVCGYHDRSGRTLVADHITPHAEGGDDSEENGQTLCTEHHHVKTAVEIARGQARRPRRARQRERHPGVM